MKKTALIPIADGTEEIEAVCIIDTLRRAGVNVKVASVNEMQITASRKVKLAADGLIEEYKDQKFDLIALPGGMPGAEHLRDCKTLIEMLNAQKASGRLFAAICASPAVVFAHHDLIDDKKATCYPSPKFREKIANPSDELVVVDGNCITSQGPATAILFAIELIKQVIDKSTAQKVAEAMLI